MNKLIIWWVYKVEIFVFKQVGNCVVFTQHQQGNIDYAFSRLFYEGNDSAWFECKSNLLHLSEAIQKFLLRSQRWD